MVEAPIRIEYDSSSESEGRVLEVHYGDGETFRFYSALGRLEEILFNKGFVRIHKKCIVSIAKVKEFSIDGVQLANGEMLPISKGYYKSNRELIKTGIGL